MSDSTKISGTGGCLCGAVRFQATGVETNHHACHCGTCRRWSSGPFFGAHTASLTVESNEFLARYDSSDWAQRCFCKQCGTTLFYYLKPADSYTVSVGAFDDSASFKVALEIFIDKKPAGYAFAGDTPTMTEAEVFAHAGAS